MKKKIVIDLAKWNHVRNLMEKSPDPYYMGMSAHLAEVPYLASGPAQEAARQLNHLGAIRQELRAHIGRKDSYIPEYAQQDILVLEQMYATLGAEAFKEKVKGDLTKIRDMTAYIIGVQAPGSIFKREDFKGGSSCIASWLYASRAHARGRIHFHSKTYEEQGVMVTKFIENCHTFCAMAGISWVVDEETVDSPQEIAVS